MQGRPSGGALSRAASLSLRSPLLAKPCLPRALNLKPASRVVLASAGGSGGSSGNLGGGGGGGGGGGSGGGECTPGDCLSNSA